MEIDIVDRLKISEIVYHQLNPDDAIALIKLRVDAENEIVRLRATLQAIVKADWRKWDELATAEDFVLWAKKRALIALAELNYNNQ